MSRRDSTQWYSTLHDVSVLRGRSRCLVVRSGRRWKYVVVYFAVVVHVFIVNAGSSRACQAFGMYTDFSAP